MSAVLCPVFAVVLAFFGFAVILSFISSTSPDLNLPLGIVILLVALILFLHGWYSFQSAKPKGTINVHNE